MPGAESGPGGRRLSSHPGSRLDAITNPLPQDSAPCGRMAGGDRGGQSVRTTANRDRDETISPGPCLRVTPGGGAGGFPSRDDHSGSPGGGPAPAKASSRRVRATGGEQPWPRGWGTGAPRRKGQRPGWGHRKEASGAWVEFLGTALVAPGLDSRDPVSPVRAAEASAQAPSDRCPAGGCSCSRHGGGGPGPVTLEAAHKWRPHHQTKGNGRRLFFPPAFRI